MKTMTIEEIAEEYKTMFLNGNFDKPELLALSGCLQELAEAVYSSNLEIENEDDLTL